MGFMAQQAQLCIYPENKKYQQSGKIDQSQMPATIRPVKNFIALLVFLLSC